MNPRDHRFHAAIRCRRGAPGRARSSGRGAGRARGFTLLELLVAISLMAVLAVLGWQGLDSVLRSRERLVDASESLRALATGFSQLEEDLRRTWPVRLMQLAVPSVSFAQETETGPPALRLLREMPPGSGPAQLQRVAYRLRDGVFERGFAMWTLPGPAGAPAAPEPRFTWQPLVDDVAGMQMRAWIDGRGWVAASGLLAPTAQSAQPAQPGAAPVVLQVTGLEVLLERRNGERVLRVLAVKD